MPALAQQAAPAANPLAAREALAQKRAAEWETLAKVLEGKIARMLPCDSRVHGAIEEVSRASQARLASLNDYLQAAAAQAKADAERARAIRLGPATTWPRKPTSNAAKPNSSARPSTHRSRI